MSRGHGKLQRRILDVLADGAYWAVDDLHMAVRKPCEGSQEMAGVFYELRQASIINRFSEGERRVFRRAVQRLVEDGSVRRGHLRSDRRRAFYRLVDKSTGTLSRQGRSK